MMSDRISQDYHSQRPYPVSSYNDGTLIAPNGRGPPPPMLSGIDPNLKKTQVLHQMGQFSANERDIVTLNPYPEAINGQRPMTIVDPTYDQIIVKPPRQNVTHGHIPVQQFVSSKDRNFTLYPNVGSYVLHLNDTYKNVTSVTLNAASIPNTASLINSRNNRFCFQEEEQECECTCVELPTADYTSLQLSVELESHINANTIYAPATPYTVIANSLTNKFEIALDLSIGCYFKLCFYGGSEKNDNRTRAIYPKNSIGPIIGYDRKDYLYGSGKLVQAENVVVGSPSTAVTRLTGYNTKFLDELSSLQMTMYPASTLGAHGYGKICIPGCLNEMGTDVYDIYDFESDTSILVEPQIADVNCIDNSCFIPWIHKAPNKYDLSSDSFVVLDIPELASNSSAGGTLVANSAAVANSFAVIPMVFPHNTKNFVISPFSGFSPVVRYYNPPIPRLSKLTIKFLDYDGNIVDFEGIDHFLEFRIVTVNQPGKYDPTGI